MRLRDISIRYKLILSFLAVTMLMFPVNFYIISATDKIEHNFSSIVDFSFPRLQALLEMKMAARRVTAFINNFNSEIEAVTINENTPTKIGVTKDTMLAYLGEIEEWQVFYQNHVPPNEKSLLDVKEITTLLDKVILTALDTFNAKERKLSKQEQVYFKNKLEAAQNALDRFINISIINESDSLNKNKLNAINATKKIHVIGWILNMAIIAISVIFSLILTGYISRPLIQLKHFASSIHQDNLTNRFQNSTHDEIGELATSINTMLENLLHTKNQLIEASRAAGVAEVATSILHNVGNVLNSIHVSAGLMQETIKKTKLNDLQKIHDLLSEHKDDLTAYTKNDERGSLLISYLQTLYIELDKEKTNVMEELTHLLVNLNHVSNVIAMQQNYGRSKGMTEPVSIAEVIDAICKIHTNKLKNLGITIIRDFENIPPITTVKAKLEQILINLIKNAVDAVEESQNPEKIIVIKVVKTPENMQIFITDNGVGIKQENIIKIFSFGFTTKKHGHGYGVHNSALLASELSGKLTASSEGFEKGSTFLLEIPC